MTEPSPGPLENGVTYMLVWIAHPGACRKCLALHGTIWTRSNLEGYLVHPQFGVIYDLTNEITWAHPYCHCSIDVAETQVDLEKVDIGEF